MNKFAQEERSRRDVSTSFSWASSGGGDGCCNVAAGAGHPVSAGIRTVRQRRHEVRGPFAWCRWVPAAISLLPSHVANAVLEPIGRPMVSRCANGGPWLRRWIWATAWCCQCRPRSCPAWPPCPTAGASFHPDPNNTLPVGCCCWQRQLAHSCYCAAVACWLAGPVTGAIG